MKPIQRRRALGLLGATALTGCAPAIPMAQLGDDPFEGGIGGTGIVGVMTGTGSVLVNGLRVEVPDRARITTNGRAASDRLLMPGVTLSMVANARRDRFEAQFIDVDTPLIGPLARHGAGYAINGTALSLDQGVAAAALVGQRVMAWGLWRRDGRLQTSLIYRAADGPDNVAGVLVGSAEKGWTIGQTRLQTTARNRLTAGQYAVAEGQFAGTAFRADTVQMGRFRQGGGTLRQLAVEGYLEPVATAPGFRLSGLGHSFDPRLALTPFAAQRAVYFGPYDGRFRARRAVVVPDAPAPRAALLTPDIGKTVADSLTGAAARPVRLR